MNFISTITYNIDLFLSETFKRFRKEKIFTPITLDARIFALAQMIDYLTIRRNYLQEERDSRKARKGGER